MKKGPWFEKAVALYLSRRLHKPVERRVMGGANDRGDLSGVAFGGREVVVEVKNRNQTALAEWVDEARREADNAGTDLYCVVHHRRGKGETQMGDQYVTMPLDVLAEILRGGKDGDE